MRTNWYIPAFDQNSDSAIRFSDTDSLKNFNIAISRRFQAVTLTLNVRSTSGVTWSNYVPNFREIEQSTEWSKNGTTFLYALTLPHINRFSQLVYCRNQEKIITILSLNIPPHVKCIATLPCEMWSVLKATIENKTTSVTTHCKKLTTGNNVFIVSVIV